MYKNTKLHLYVLPIVMGLFLTLQNVLAAPSATQVPAVWTPDAYLTITGSGFGQGPTVEVFDNFDNETVGNQPNFNATVGAWTNWNSTSYIPTIIEGWGHKKALSIYNGSYPTGLQKIFTTPTTEAFVSLSIYNPNYFPGFLTASPYVFPYQQLQYARSAWKMAWLMNTNRGDLNNQDICVPFTFMGSSFVSMGNHTPWVWYHKDSIGLKSTFTNNVWPGDYWYSFSNWSRASWWGRAGNDPVVDAGEAWVQVFNEGVKQETETGAGVLFNAAYTPQWDRIKVPGWLASGLESSPDMTIGYTDIYVATGSNARARVEICNNSTYALATRCSIQPSVSWQQDAISVKVNLGTFTLNDNAYLFIFDRDGNSNATGLPITFAQLPTSYGMSDFTTLLSDWHKLQISSADLNSDNIINAEDLGIMMSKWN